MTGSVTPQLVEPAYRTHPRFTQTLGPEVGDLCAMAGFAPDPEQQLCLDMIFALDGRGKSAAFEFGVVVSRQNLKTGLFKQAALGWLFVLELQLITWSAHEFSTTKEALRDLSALIDGTPELRKRLKTVRLSNDDPSIELHGGQRIKFKARTKSGGRGLTGDRVVLDEAFALTPDHMGALMPTLSVVPDPQILYGSSAGLADSDVLRGIRDRGRSGGSARLAYAEWTGETDDRCALEHCSHLFGVEGCLLDRRDLWKASNPLLGRTRDNGTSLTFEYVEAERQALPPAEFARERMGWWDEPGAVEPPFGAGFWEACGAPGRPEGLRPQAFAVAASLDLTFASISAAATDDQGVTWVQTLQHGPGINWTVDRLSELVAADAVPVAVDGRGPAAVLVPGLERAGFDLRVASTADVLDACAGLFEKVRDARVRHLDEPELNSAVAGAVKRPVGDRWAWGRKKSAGDISPLEAATLASWAAARPQTAALGFYSLSGES